MLRNTNCCSSHSIFGAIGVLLNKRYSIYMIGWSVAQFVLSALYVRVVFAFCRSSHALAGARSKVRKSEYV